MRIVLLTTIGIIGVMGMATNVVIAQTDEQVTFFVAPDGNDAWSGTQPDPAGDDGPFASLERARDAIRELKRRQGTLKQPVTVFLRGGIYSLKAPFVLTPEDSGTEACPVTYAAYEDETPMLSGGRTITGWTPGENGLWVTRLPEVQAGEWNFRQLFVKEPDAGYFERRYRPSRGAFVIAGLTSAPARSGMGHRRSQDEFRFFPGDIEDSENRDDVEIVALHDWSSSRLRIRELDMENHVVKFTGYPVYRIGHWWRDGRNPYYVENVKEALGKSGEWYLDRPAGTLSYRPLPGEDMATLTVIAPQTDQLVLLQGDTDLGTLVEHVVLRGLTFAHTHWTLPEEGYSSGQGMTGLPAALTAHGAVHCRIEACTLAHLAAYAVELGGGCRDNKVIGNRVFDLGGGGVKVGGNPVPADNLIANNVISDGGLVHFSAHGIWAGITQHTTIRHNIVRRFLYSNISVGWSWNDKPTACRDNVIEYNHIHDSMMLLADGGGIYTLGFQPGNVIRGNHIHEVHRSKFAGSAPNNGMFFDQGSKGFLIERNVIYNTSAKPVRHNQNSADWHTWIDNVFDVTPEAPDFPRELVAQAGLEPEYRYLDAEPAPINPTPILSMTLPPPPPPGPIVDDFEEYTTGNGPAKRKIQGANETVHIRVTDETAAKGARSLKFTDGPTPKPFYPYVIYEPRFVEGRASIGFFLRMGKGAVFSMDGRDYVGGGFHNGPSIRVDPGGALLAGSERLTDLPLEEWVEFEVKFGLAEDNDGTYTLTVTLPGEEPQSFGPLPMQSKQFKVLDWVGFVAGATQPAVFYLDEVRITNE